MLCYLGYIQSKARWQHTSYTLRALRVAGAQQPTGPDDYWYKYHHVEIILTPKLTQYTFPIDITAGSFVNTDFTVNVLHRIYI